MKFIRLCHLFLSQVVTYFTLNNDIYLDANKRVIENNYDVDEICDEGKGQSRSDVSFTNRLYPGAEPNINYSYKLQGQDWAGTCATGQLQSPIDVISKETTDTTFERFKLRNHNQWIPLTLFNTSHWIKFSIPPIFQDSLPFYVCGGGFDSSYKFYQGHFHWGSEDDEGGGFLKNMVNIVYKCPFFTD